jgi:hypothetical protein
MVVVNTVKFNWTAHQLLQTSRKPTIQFQEESDIPIKLSPYNQLGQLKYVQKQSRVKSVCKHLSDALSIQNNAKK